MIGGSGVQMNIRNERHPDEDARCGLSTIVALCPGKLPVEKGGSGTLSRNVNRGKGRELDRTHEVADVINQAPKIVNWLPIADKLK